MEVESIINSFTGDYFPLNCSYDYEIIESETRNINILLLTSVSGRWLKCNYNTKTNIF